VVVAVTPSGRLTARAGSARFYPEGTVVTDRTGTIRGRVARVFGPVDRPYLSVRLRRAPRPHEAAALVGTPLSAVEE
jgi:rRNA processing protein Gar1